MEVKKATFLINYWLEYDMIKIDVYKLKLLSIFTKKKFGLKCTFFPAAAARYLKTNIPFRY